MTATTERPKISAPEELALLEAPKRPRPATCPAIRKIGSGWRG